MSSSFDLPEVDHFVCGTVGPTGQRIFYLQIIKDRNLVSLRLEKQQVAVLCDYLERVLATHEIPESMPAHMADLTEPVIEEWTVGSMMVALNEASGQIILIAEELTEENQPDPGSARFGLTKGQVEAFIDGTRRIINGGRPICRLCGRPIDPDGHACPRLN